MENRKQIENLAFDFGGLLLSLLSLVMYWVLSAVFVGGFFGTAFVAALSIGTSLAAVLLGIAGIPMLLAGAANVIFRLKPLVRGLLALAGGAAFSVLCFVCGALYAIFPRTIGVPVEVLPLVLEFGQNILLFSGVALLLVYIFVQLCKYVPAPLSMKGIAFGVFAAALLLSQVLVFLLTVLLFRAPALFPMGAAIGGAVGFCGGAAVLVMAALAQRREKTAKTVYETVQDEPLEN